MGVHLSYIISEIDCIKGEDMRDFDFGEFIRNRRKELDLDQEDAAEKANLSLYTYGRIERGETVPRLDQINKIFSAFGLSLKEISEDSEAPENLTARDCLNKVEFYIKELRKLLGQ